MTAVLVKHGSLTDGDESVLVNASNTGLALGSGVSLAIRLSCGGAQYQDELLEFLVRELGGALDPGAVCITGAGSHPRAKHILHAAVMDYREGSPAGRDPDVARVEEICAAIWPAVEDLGGSQSIAMVALGAGTGGLGVRQTMTVACRSLKAHLGSAGSSNLERVVFYGYALHEYVVSVEVVSSFFDVPRSSVPDEVWNIVDDRQGDG